jgi:hypothetical protein
MTKDFIEKQKKCFPTFECRTNAIPNAETTAAVKLTEGKFHVEKWLWQIKIIKLQD